MLKTILKIKNLSILIVFSFFLLLIINSSKVNAYNAYTDEFFLLPQTGEEQEELMELLSERDRLVYEKLNGYTSEITLDKINNYEVEGFIKLVDPNYILLEGTGHPDSQIMLIIESEYFMTIAEVNEEGKWELEVKNIFEKGIHNIKTYAIAGAISADTKNIGSFEIVEGSRFIYLFWGLVIILPLMFLFLVVFKVVEKKRKK